MNPEEEKAKGIERSSNDPLQRGRSSDSTADEPLFKWTRFYEAFADKLLTYRDRRKELVAGIYGIAPKLKGFSHLQDKTSDGSFKPLSDICPFTTIGLFNRGLTEDNHKAIARELATLLGVSEPVPTTFEGIPFLNKKMSKFFGYEYQRQPDDIDVLWEVFARGIAFAGSEDPAARTAFATAFDDATSRFLVKWNLTMGLYWIRPWDYLTLDSCSQDYMKEKLNIRITQKSPKGCCTASDYLQLRDTLKDRFQEEAYPVHSFPELSHAAWNFKGKRKPATRDVIERDAPDKEAMVLPEEASAAPPIKSFSIEDILADGCFIDGDKLTKIIERLETKKNLILQGPPGTGKTWLAKRLAFALVGQRDDGKVRAVQFHPNLSYEDFVRGWRPAGDGRLTLVDGPFLEMIEAARKDPDSGYVIVIEEINRGNPAQIFGEMLTLLEADKRTPTDALELTYKRTEDERVFIPDNLYVIGTMNLADRSIALVDLALRRRFAFVDLEPVFGEPWHEYVRTVCGVEREILLEIEKRLNALNGSISADPGLGPQFRVGHSYVTPPFGKPIDDGWEWFRQVVNSEIGPLLDEYWFDNPEKSREMKELLLKEL